MKGTTVNILTLNSVEDAEQFVTDQQALGNDVRWDNYDIVFFRPSEQGVYSAQFGAWRNGRYGFENRFTVTDKGTWNIDYRNVRRARPVRS